MKKIIMIIVLGSIFSGAQAQADLGKFLEGGVEDGNQLLQDYLSPFFTGFGYAMNSGWYNTGKPHKLLGLDITASVSGAQVPTEAMYFKVNAADYTNLTTAPSETGMTKFPTIFGPNLDADDIPYLVFNAGTADEIAISGPSGLGIEEAYGFPNAVPGAAVQLGVGLVKNTEIKLRLIPEQTIGDPGQETTTKMFGIGVMHDVKQWIPGIKNLPFDLSAFLAYSNMQISSQMNADHPDQTAEFNVSGTTAQAIISKKLAILTVYAGAGYSASTVNFQMLGDYNITNVPVDPINFDYNAGGLKANLGARLKLLIFTFHAEYAVQEYNTFTGGVGISIR